MESEVKGVFIIVAFAIVASIAFRLVFGDDTSLRFLTSFIAGFLGVFLGFYLHNRAEKKKDDQLRIDSLNRLHDELVKIRNALYPQTEETFILFTDIWDSMISSGLIKLLSTDQVNKLSKVYKDIKAASYEAEWVRRDSEELTKTPLSETARFGAILDVCDGNKASHKKRMENTSNDIEAVLKENWWNTKNLAPNVNG